MNRSIAAVIILVCLACWPAKSGAQENEPYWEAVGIKMVSIPAGSFRMGGDDYSTLRPVHTVALDAFRMSATEITQAQFKAVMEYNPSYFTDNENLPAEKINWFTAVKFCNRLSELAGLDSCYQATDELDYFGNNHMECDYSKNGFRLPAEAEWEYAARAGTITNYCTGNSESDLDRAGWYRKNCGHRTHQVAGKEPNAWGLYDMHGNVWEWCNDWYYQNYDNSAAKNPTGPETGHDHVLRGGSWPDNAGYCRSANRCVMRPSFINFAIGFRVVYRP
ncbi:MAG: formylglycine-generating enzyme family protein [Gemmatimonadota bacterium]|nr:formylglycine-generating enzyme family protein [Gemmatimonadota bacterium]